ncbi:MAG: large conductance mechanosensitive channel protein MscL [Erysipelotrichaceae bacterium]|nr:large conductance mechanosensitive channel protein MscL [Erysipelotrichaceae bacterium]
MKKFFKEFKEFITRGSVLDMAVGVIVGSAFTAIVTALSNNILKPIINWILTLIFGQNSLSDIYTYLKKVEVDGVVDLTQSIYIDWGAFINAIINFLIIAFVLFVIVKTINNFQRKMRELEEKVKKQDEQPAPEVTEPEPEPVDEHLELLKEIRDLLKEKEKM